MQRNKGAKFYEIYINTRKHTSNFYIHPQIYNIIEFSTMLILQFFKRFILRAYHITAHSLLSACACAV
jgi:hypothetical protein